MIARADEQLPGMLRRIDDRFAGQLSTPAPSLTSRAPAL
jgi:hypothetical protein